MVPAVISCGDAFQSCAPWVRKLRRNRADLRRAGVERSEQVTQCVQPALSNLIFYQTVPRKPNCYSAAGLKLWSTVFDSLAATVTFWVCSPSFSCTKAIV